MELIVLEILMLKSLFSVIVSLYDLQSHETILTERLEGKDEIAFSYTQKKKQNKTKTNNKNVPRISKQPFS